MTLLAPPPAGHHRPHPHRQVAQEKWVLRFGLTERLAHWWTVAMVLTAVLTGLAMGDDGGSGPVLYVHVGAVVMIGAGLLTAALLGNRRALFTAGRQLFRVESRDISWLAGRIRHPLQPGGDPSWGMFNAGQKVLAWMLSLSLVVTIATGIGAWSAGGEGGLHGPAVVLTLVLLGAHIFMAVVNPATRPALAGMVFGRVRRSWAAQHHSEWLEQPGRDISDRGNPLSRL